MSPRRLINDLDVNVFNFKKFGKELPKQHKLSPHSFIQVALQLAYYRSAINPQSLIETFRSQASPVVADGVSNTLIRPSLEHF